MKTEKQGGITNVSAYSLDRIEAWCKEKCDDDGIWGLLEGHFKAVRLAQDPRVEEVTVEELERVIQNFFINLSDQDHIPWSKRIARAFSLHYLSGIKITTGDGEKR